MICGQSLASNRADYLGNDELRQRANTQWPSHKKLHNQLLNLSASRSRFDAGSYHKDGNL